MDVDLSPGANYGCTLNWRDIDFAPATNKKPVEVVTTLDEKAFNKRFVGWCKTKRRNFNAKTPRGKERKGQR